MEYMYIVVTNIRYRIIKNTIKRNSRRLHEPEVSIVTVSPAANLPPAVVIVSAVVSMRSNLEPQVVYFEEKLSKRKKK